jgi:Fe-S-cluster containining protein
MDPQSDTNITTALCTRCGLCCNGSMFDDVELAGETEATTMEAMGLAVDFEERPLLLQPCTALQGTCCSVYPHRPGCCRTFACRLLQDVQEGMLDLEGAWDIVTKTREHVQRMMDLCAKAGDASHDLSLKERCAEVLAQPLDGDDDEANHIRGDLARAMDTMGHLVRQHFLGDT